MVGAVEREGELEEITDALLLTRSDDFNGLAAAELRRELGHGHVFRLAPEPDEPYLLPPTNEAGIIGNSALTFAELSSQFASGARMVVRSSDEQAVPEATRTEVPLFAVDSDGRLSVAADGRPPFMRPGDTVIVLAPPPTSPGRRPRARRDLASRRPAFAANAHAPTGSLDVRAARRIITRPLRPRPGTPARSARARRRDYTPSSRSSTRSRPGLLEQPAVGHPIRDLFRTSRTTSGSTRTMVTPIDLDAARGAAFRARSRSATTTSCSRSAPRSTSSAWKGRPSTRSPSTHCPTRCA